MLIKYVNQDGSGDYTDVTTAFNDMLLSGVLASGEILNYSMIIDSNIYSGVLAGTIPYSGEFNIIGNNTYLKLLDTINVSGINSSTYSANLNIENCVLDFSGITSYSIITPSGFGLRLKDICKLNVISGVFNNGGNIQLINTNCCGVSGISKTFIKSVSGFLSDISNCSISNFEVAIESDNANINKSYFYDNQTGIYYNNNYNVSISNTLFYDNNVDIDVGSGNLIINTSTLNSVMNTNNTTIIADRIISNSLVNVSGSITNSSIISNSCLYPFLDVPGTLTLDNVIDSDPKFNNPTNKDFRLKFLQIEGSPCIEIKPDPTISSTVLFNIYPSMLKVYDNRGLLDINEFLSFTYTQGSTIVFSDYNKELVFADRFRVFKELKYKIFIDILFNEYNILTTQAFSTVDQVNDSFPWDWDEFKISDAQIKDYNLYIIPRSIIDIERIIQDKLGNFSSNILYGSINKQNVIPYIKSDIRGISYDYDLSVPGKNVMWVIDGNNQSLIKQNVYTSEELEYYPLLCRSPDKAIVRPSGLIYTGVRGDYYTFIKQDNPSEELLGLSELGDFYWISTIIDSKFDIRGIKSYKDNLFITATQYPIDITNRTNINTNDGIGKLFQYNNNDIFTNFIKHPSQENVPKNYTLASGNFYPTDLTIYEDGNIFIADYISTSGIYKYDLAYDYAITQTSYDNETRILLREEYTDVDL